MVQLRGVNISGQEFADEQMATSPGSQPNMWGGQPEDVASTIAGIVSWGCNVIRVPLNEDFWLGINPTRSPATYQAGIIQFVHDLRAAGLYVILDLHWNGPAAVPALSQQPMADQDHSPAFWTSVAQTFAYDLGIIFECYNEPFFYYITSTENEWQVLLNGGTLTEYLTGGTPYTESVNWQAMGMQAIIATVRATGAQNLILVGGADWCNDLTGWIAPTDPLSNFGVAWHAYPGEAHTAVNEPEIVTLAAARPVVVTETGGDVTTNTADAPNTLLGQLLAWWDTAGIGYVGWTWDAWNDPQDVLITSWTGAPTAGYGQLWQAHLQARAGLS